MRQPMNEDTFRALRDYIYGRSGIFVSDAKKYFLESRLQRVLEDKNLNSYEDYLNILKYGADTQDLEQLFNVVTTNETFFFRDMYQFDVLKKEILDEIVIDNLEAGRKEIRIWCAGCSTGEEPYTVAMLLNERMDVRAFRLEIVATDISSAVIQSAKAGIYGSYAVRNVPESYLKRYFVFDGQYYALSDSVKNMVKFMKLNLGNEKEMFLLQNYDMILCRNVLIYFDERSKQKVVSKFYDALKPNGYLLLSGSESLHNVTRAFRPTVINKTVLYKKV